MAGSFQNSLINNSIYHLLNFEKYTSFQMAAREAAISNNFQIAIFTGDFNIVFCVETRHKVSIEATVRKLIEKNSNVDEEAVRLSYEGVTTYWGSISISDVKYYLMLVDNDDNYSQDDIIKLAEIFEVAIRMWNYQPVRDTAAEFIRALRRGNRGLAFSLLEGLGIRENHTQGVFFVPNIEKEESLRLVAAFESEKNIRILKVNEGGELVCVLVKNPGEKQIESGDWKKLADEFESAGAGPLYYVMWTDGIEGMCNAFKLINDTEAFMKLIFPKKNLFGECELALADSCISICMNSGQIKKNYMNLIRGFSNIGEGKASQLLETLEIFMLDAGMSAQNTSKIMDIHVNTVQYRLKRIKEILGVEISDPSVAPSLMVTMAISRISKEIKSF